MTTSSTSSDPGPDESATALLLLRSADDGDTSAAEAALAPLVRYGFRLGPAVGGVVAVTGPPLALRALQDHLWAAEQDDPPAEADPEVLDVLRRAVADFAWDEGAEVF